ncbi:hypothetical protein [Bailinhaonella thermotolerans]|uniref:Uncharacterized protein n=1 Tax=Bailinhaonella thermotolerans TaxID=1070861 RepID=A0A3A4AVG2_9ACTN|nr:hypothetical protein [Bailinhaonella thermotolerans]RJL32701.1 hypothetical protein D5H75_14505 [Bailinhaonella thermotolerans]
MEVVLMRRSYAMWVVAGFSSAVLAAGVQAPAAANSPAAPVRDPTVCRPMDYCGPFGEEAACEHFRHSVIRLGYHAPNRCFYNGQPGPSPRGWYFFIFRKHG